MADMTELLTSVATLYDEARATITARDATIAEKDDYINQLLAQIEELQNPSQIIWASQNDDDLTQWHAINASDSGCSIGVVRCSIVGIPDAPDGPYAVEAKISGSGSDYARTIFMHDSVPTPKWGEGTDIWYQASFYLPAGFYAARSSINDIMRWDAYVNGSSDMQGGLGIGTDGGLYIMSNWPYTRPLETDFRIPEGKWTRIEVHQFISELDVHAYNAIYADGEFIDESITQNYKGGAYPADEGAINRLRFGLVSEGSTSDRLTLYFSRAIISRGRVG